MPLSRKVVWNEGMLLTPHHFQQWDRYFHNLLDFRQNTRSSFSWGLIELKIDEESLRNGTCLLVRGTGVLPDGLPFAFADPDEVPDSRTIEEKHITESGVVEVFIAAPVESAGRMNCDLNNGADTKARYRSKFQSVVDENTGRNSKEVLFADKNLRLLFSGEDEFLENHVYFKIAELERTAANAFKLKETYIPPCLHIAASPHLMSHVSNLLNSLSDNSRLLAEKLPQRTDSLTDIRTTDLNTYWKRFIVNSCLPLLAHYTRVEAIHPEQLYRTLCQLASELMTFFIKEHPDNLPEYRHDDLSYTFNQLYQTIQKLLKIGVESKNYRNIDLKRGDDGTLLGHILDDQLLDWDFYLAVNAEMSEGDLINEIKKNVKISSLEDIQLLIEQALPGIKVNHSTRPPDPLPIKMGFQYFRLENHGELWEKVKRAKNIALYLPDKFPNLKISIMAVRE